MQNIALLTEGSHREVGASDNQQQLDRETLYQISGELNKHFPHTIEETELVLMDVSPHRLHAYWRITPWKLESAGYGKKSTDAKLILRFHDLTQGNTLNTPSFDIEINGASGSRYVELWEDARSYHAELGVLRRDGRLIDLARSNTVELPKEGPSSRHGTQVLTLTPSADNFFDTTPGSRTVIGINAPDRRQDWQANPDLLTDATLQHSLKQLFPLFPDPSAPIFEAHTMELIPPTPDQPVSQLVPILPGEPHSPSASGNSSHCGLCRAPFCSLL